MTEALEIDNSALTPHTTEILSPFLPGTQIQYAWDSTSLGLIKTCPRLYFYTMIEGWQPRDESIHLKFGIEYHQALQDYDIARAADADHTTATHMAVRDLLLRTAGWEVDLESKAGRYKNRTSLVRTVCNYLDHFSVDPAKTYILDDGRPAVELSFRFELDWGPRAAIRGETDLEGLDLDSPQGMSAANAPSQPYLLSGHLDRVVDYQGALYVMDRKTTTTTPGPYYFNQYEPNNQMSLYTLASRVVLSAPVKGVIIDAAQILVDTNRYVRGFTFRTPDQIDEWLEDLNYVLAIAETYAENGYWPMNDTACDKFGGCRFRSICSKSPQVRENFLRSEFIKQAPDERWNPLKPR